MADRERERKPADQLGDSIYPPGAVDDVTVPPTDPVREAKRRDWGDPADVKVDPKDLLNGGPTRTPGMMTTTGGKAGPTTRPKAAPPSAETERPSRGKVAPTTTGDATTGGMQTPEGGSTSDASRGGDAPTR